MNKIVETIDDIFDKEQDDGLILKNEYSNRRLHLSRYDRMVRDIVLSIKSNEYILDPDFQRNFVWNKEKCSKLIESILINVPIPNIYASDDTNGKWIIVDGIQRLTALNNFYNDEFKLQHLEILTELNNKKYSELDDKYRIALDKGNISIILLEEDTSPNIKFDIFMRLNTGGEELKPQELRNCLYRGKFNDAIKNEMADDANFRRILPKGNNKEVYKRMEDIELVLRFLALDNDFLYNKFTFNSYTGNLKSFLNNYMSKYKNADEQYINDQSIKFKTTVEKIIDIFGDKIFLRENGKFNKSIYDMIMICVANNNFDRIDKKKLTCKMKDMLTRDANFTETLKKSTSSKENIVKRISKCDELIQSCKV